MEEHTQRLRVGRTHVLRHSYEPSDPLIRLIQDFTGPSLGSRFLLRSSKGVYVESAAYARGAYREEDEEVKETVNRAAKHPIYLARAAFHLVQAPSLQDDRRAGAPTSYRLCLLPFQSHAFDELNQSLDCYPESMQVPGPSRHYLYLDLPAQAAYTMRDREGAENELRQTIAHNAHKRLYYATVRDVRSMEVALPANKQHAQQ